METRVKEEKDRKKAEAKPKRGGAETAKALRFTIDGQGVISDKQTGLQWHVGHGRDTDWNEAKRWVENLTVDGGGWRMPGINELKGIYEEGVGDFNLDPVFEVSKNWVWSGETDGSSSAWSFFFPFGSGGERFSRSRIDSYSLRAFAVRSR